MSSSTSCTYPKKLFNKNFVTMSYEYESESDVILHLLHLSNKKMVRLSCQYESESDILLHIVHLQNLDTWNDDVMVVKVMKPKKFQTRIRKMRVINLLFCGALSFINSLADSLPRNIAILISIFSQFSIWEKYFWFTFTIGVLQISTVSL